MNLRRFIALYIRYSSAYRYIALSTVHPRIGFGYTAASPVLASLVSSRHT